MRYEGKSFIDSAVYIIINRLHQLINYNKNKQNMRSSARELPHYVNLERKQANGGNSFKLVIAGTVALTAAALCILQINVSPSPQFMQFYGDAVHEEKQIAFMQFLAKYGKTYASKSDMGSRFEIFSANFDKIKAHNSQEDAYKMGVNQFSDMTFQEMNSFYANNGLSKKPTPKKNRL